MDEVRGFDEGTSVASSSAAEEQRKVVPTTPNGAVGTALEVVDFGEDQGAGLEGLGLDEQLTPFVRMLQGLSPQLNPGKAQYAPGAKLGMLINTATGEIYDAIDVVICAREHVFGQWIPRDLGEGFRGNLPPDDALVRQTISRMAAKYGASAKFKLPRYDGKTRRWSDEPARTKDTDEEIELVESGQLYVIYGPAGALDENTAQRAIVAMTSTSFPVYQSILTRHNSWKWLQNDGRMLPAPLWTYRWRFSAAATTNASGQEFFIWNAKLAPPAENYREARLLPTDPLYAAGKEFNRLFREGAVKADYDAAASAAGRDAGSDDAVPF